MHTAKKQKKWSLHFVLISLSNNAKTSIWYRYGLKHSYVTFVYVVGKNNMLRSVLRGNETWAIALTQRNTLRQVNAMKKIALTNAQIGQNFTNMTERYKTSVSHLFMEVDNLKRTHVFISVQSKNPSAQNTIKRDGSAQSDIFKTDAYRLTCEITHI